jgi:hypothetical protein
MMKSTDADFHANACKKVAALDIYKNAADRATFCAVAIDYAPSELREKGIDLDKFGTFEELSEYCALCLKEHPNLDTEMALIVVTHAIQVSTKDILGRKTSGN